MQVKIKSLHPDAVMPQYASDGAGCFDLHSIDSGLVAKERTFDTGLAFEIPAGHVMLIFSRSGHGFKNDTRLANCVGVIDHDYRGEVKVKLSNDNHASSPLMVNAGDRIAQGMIIPFPKVEFQWADDLSETGRGTGGFGSTGE
ncbi:dUTP diphosphatase [Flavobacterium sp.]|jgi:dUTP pyrophosphatase|uniref:dUTP diphosphatase n=1 Tax=Flavobacterium sp. TaxID=239 RepID=UPI0037BEFC59